MTTFFITVLLVCIIAGKCMVLTPKTPYIVRVREGDALILEADVDSHETNVRFTGPGNRVIGAHDHQATGTYLVLNETYTGFLYTVTLTISHVDRFRSGIYHLTGFDAYSWEQLEWVVIVQVVPVSHVSVPSIPTCDVNNAEYAELRCGTYNTHDDVYWEFLSCNVTVRGAGGIISQFDQCDTLSEVDDYERKELLYHAAKHGEVQQVSVLLMLGTVLNRPLYMEESPLCMSARRGQIEIVNLLLNAGGFPLNYPRRYSRHSELQNIYHRTIFSEGITALECAAWSGSVPLVEMILERESDLHARNMILDRKGRSPILFAAMSGSLKLVKQFLTWGENWNHTDGEGRTPILFAALSGSVELVEYFESLGADLFAKDFKKRNILFYAARSNSLDLVEYLVSAGVNPLEENSGGETPTVDAVLGGSVPVFKAFRKRGGIANFTGSAGESLLHYAAAMGHVDMVKDLVANGLLVTATDINGYTPLHVAVFLDHLSVVRTLIALGGSVEARDGYGRIPLHYTTHRVNPACVELLLTAGSDVNTVDNEGLTTLHYFTASNPIKFDLFLSYFQEPAKTGWNVENAQDKAPVYQTWISRSRRVLALLLGASGNPNARDKFGITPIHFIAQRHTTTCNSGLIQLLVNAGGNPNARDVDGQTPLHWAARYNVLSCARSLVQVGASTTAVTKDGKTPLDVAKESSHGQEVAEWQAALKS